VIGCVPDQPPGLAVSVCPSCTVPDTVGNDVFCGATSVSTTSCGATAEPASRLLRLIAVVLADLSAKLNEPLPETSGVTSRATHPAANEPDEAVADAANGGAFDQVIVFSPQLVPLTPQTDKPLVDPFFAFTRNVAFVTDPAMPVRSKRRYARCSGDALTRNVVAVPKFVDGFAALTYASATVANVCVDGAASERPAPPAIAADAARIVTSERTLPRDNAMADRRLTVFPLSAAKEAPQ
jgi:hypothetical protein